MGRKKSGTEAVKGIKIDPAFRRKQKIALLHKHRQVVRFNDPELKAIEEYCTRFGIKAKGPALRKIIIEAVLKGLDESQPTLF